MTDQERQTIAELCGGNDAAVALIEETWLLACVYDDAIDGQKQRTDDEIHRAFAFAVFGLHANPVWRAHPELRLALLNSIACWRAANALQYSQDKEVLHSAYVLRCSPYQFFVSVVLAVSGMEAAVKAAAFFYGRRTNDSLAEYLAEHGVKE